MSIGTIPGAGTAGNFTSMCFTHTLTLGDATSAGSFTLTLGVATSAAGRLIT